MNHIIIGAAIIALSIFGHLIKELYLYAWKKANADYIKNWQSEYVTGYTLRFKHYNVIHNLCVFALFVGIGYCLTATAFYYAFN
jgi:hypothetical protein